MRIQLIGSLFTLTLSVLWGGETLLAKAKAKKTAAAEQKTPAAKASAPKTSAASSPCSGDRNPLCQSIMKLNPSLTPVQALTLSNAFHRVAKRHNLPPNLLVAIAKQESNFRLDVVRQVNGLVKNETGSYEPVSVGSDFCMMQINAFNIKSLNLDANRLVSDSDYCINAGAQILKSFEAKSKPTDKTPWWTRYNAASDLHRRIYMEHVKRHWHMIDPHLDSRVCPASGCIVSNLAKPQA